MLKRFLFAAISILALPLLFSASQHENLISPASSLVAFAGHNTYGGWCECGAPGCICDPGESIGQKAGPVSDRNGHARNQGATSGSVGRTLGFDLGSGALMLALAFLVWTRFRA